ncbi:MAG: hypothetical protein ACOZAN_03950 [Patescibacteria group bacterium]
MLKIQLGKVFAFLPRTNIDPNEALIEFLDDIDTTQLNVSEEILQGLSSEWLLFDYEPKNGRSLIEQYYFNDPDNLSETELRELRQIIETHSLHLLQTYASSQPPYVFLQSVFTGKKFKVYDRAMSQSINSLQGSIFGRIAKVGKIYYLVGSNPITFPTRHTQRSIKIFAKEKTPTPTLKDIVKSLVKPKRQNKKIVSIKQERKKIEKRFCQLATKFLAKATFVEVVEFIYKEKYDRNIANFITDLMKIGIPEVMCIENIDLFQGMWNYFPHKQLEDKCPHELYERELQSAK